MLSGRKRESTQPPQSRDKTSKSKTTVGAMKQPVQCPAQMALMGAPSTPVLNYQPHFVGSQTISRSSNLHKQFYAQAQAAANRCSLYQQAVPPTGYLYYDQPTSGYQVPHQHPLYGTPGQAHTLHRYSYAPLTLGLRAARDRGPIPMAMLQQAVYQQPVEQLDDGTKQAGLEAAEQKKAPAKMIYQEPTVNLMRTLEQQARLNKPLCRCRVIYLGSSVPHITKNGLHGIQEPLRHLYPEEQFNSANLRLGEKMARASANSNCSEPTLNQTIDISHLSSSLGIDSWLSVWSNGLLLENVDELGRDVRRFYSIESLHYCAAVRFFDTTVLIQATNQPGPSTTASLGLHGHKTDANSNNNQQHQRQQSAAKQQEAAPATPLEAARRGVVRFLPLDAPIFQYPGMMDANHPPVFAAIMRRTSGIKVLECHAFICRRDAASNALVRCCTHAYSDFLSAKRLSADFGLLQQQQASAYLGHTTSAKDELVARGQTLPSRRLRSASAARHGKSSRAPLDGGQYQVIEALMNQTPPDAASNGHRSGSQKRRSARHAPANSTGTNSNELTHSESVNSADESEPEDNYAIIPKSSSTINNFAAAASRKVAPAEHRSGRDRSSRRRSRTVKGSSKSLFKDFMPPQLGSSHGQSGHEVDMEKLSHSLDYLAMLSSQQPLADSSSHRARGGAAQPAQKGDYDEPWHELGGAQSDIMYSIVSTKSRRHSKSMQNLVQQQLQQPHASSMDHKQASRASARLASADGKGSLSRAHRRSASLQDILGRRQQQQQQQQQQQFDAPPVPPSPSSFASLSRRSSLRSSLASRSQRGRRRRSTSSSHGNRNGSQHHHDELGQRRSSAEANNGRIYATCDDSYQQAEQRRILRPDCCAAKSTSCSQSRAGSSKRSRSKRRGQDQGRPPAEQPPAGGLRRASNCYEPVHLESVYNPLLGSPAPPAALYMPPAAFYGYPGGAPLYSSNSIYDTVTPPPGPFMPLPYVHPQYQHPQQQLFFAPPQALAVSRPGQLQAADGRFTPTVGPTTCAKDKGTSKSKRKSAALTTRFRCLSPPLNFFAASTNQLDRQPEALLAGSHSSQLGEALRDAEQESAGQLREVEQRRADLARGEVVSGQPGFMSNRSGETAKLPAQVSSVGRKQKMSWMKRLSITLSAGGSASQATAQAFSAAAQLGERDSRASGLNEAPVRPAAAQAEPEAVAQLASVPENLQPDELSNDATGGPDGQSLPAQQWPDQAHESGDNQMDGFQEQPAPQPAPQPQPQHQQQQERGNEKKTKRKRTGLFSGALTLGRSSGQKRAQSGKIVT